MLAASPSIITLSKLHTTARAMPAEKAHASARMDKCKGNKKGESYWQKHRAVGVGVGIKENLAVLIKSNGDDGLVRWSHNLRVLEDDPDQANQSIARHLFAFF
ncbi:hypothetical protein V6N13_044110 [Hibiscus sabdariffa]|uniref:Uncharacterized protein n=1 Tax=Hibiscus sabdariffa TaxID=183260 RepID=A0ABR2RH66_9ROSI